MSPKVFSAFEEIINSFFIDKIPNSVIEIGAYHWSLLALDKFKDSRKVALNAFFDKKSEDALKKHELVVGNANDMQFNDNEFDCVMSCSVLEHDKYFWKSLIEMKRILKPEGLMVIGVPIYMRLKTDYKNTTLTYARHGYAYNADFYRFSEQAVHELFFENCNIFNSAIVRKYPNPYLVVGGVKNG